MKLVRFSAGTGERLGALQGERVVDLAAALSAVIAGAGMSPDTARARAAARLPASMRAFLASGQAGLEAAREALAFTEAHADGGLQGSSLSMPVSEARLLPPVGDPQKIICIGQNYRDHCEEQHQPLPERAIIFAKFPTALNAPGAPIVLPRLSTQVDYEAEFAFVIGKRGRQVPPDQVRDYVAGYMCFNDVSARDIQSADGQWVRAKTFDTFAPSGPALVTADEIPDPHALDIGLTLNGVQMQRSNTRNLIFDVWYLVSYLSEVVTLEPGDIVSTGTPGGVGVFRKPQVFLKPGDEVSVTIQGLGTLTNPVVAA